MTPSSSPQKPAFREAFLYWLKLGFISFGGPAGQIAMMHSELVERKKWIPEENFLHALNFCMLLPGPEAQQLATYNGWRLHGIKGGIAAGALFVLPSIFILLGISYIYARFGEIAEVAAILAGIKAVVVAIVLEAVWKMAKKSFNNWIHFMIAAMAFLAIYILHVQFPLIILAAAGIGFAVSISGAGAKAAPDLIEKQRIPFFSFLKPFAVCLALWLLPFFGILLTLGWKSLPMKLYLFFTQAAFVTFGGAYSVLAYVNQVAVNQYGWITAQQAIDGFGLAETTPGPLIMVLQFIGFMAGWNNPGEIEKVWFAALCALLTTFATFLPSFLFIFTFAPLVERFQDSQMLKTVLSGISAAVVGVILSLALTFGAAVVFHNGKVDFFALAVCGAALTALFRFKIDVLWLVAGGGLLGFAYKLIFP